MTITDLAHQVAEVREAQKKYFRTRTPAAMDEAKRLERALDATLMDLLRQPSLFDVMERRFGPAQ